MFSMNNDAPKESEDSSKENNAEIGDKGIDENLDCDDVQIEDKSNSSKSFFSQFSGGEFITNLILAGLFASFLSVFYNDFNEQPKFSTLLTMIQVSCIVLFFVIRVAPSKTSTDPKDWTIAIIATYLPMLLVPTGAEGEIVFLLILQLIGIFISILGLISLNTSIGIVPAIRNIKTRGLYWFVRHPIYFGYFLSMTAMVLQNLSIFNIIILLGIYAADIYRIIAEEKLLSKDPDYQNYKARVKWRLLPFIW